MNIISDYKSSLKLGERLKNGDIVYMSSGEGNGCTGFYGIYCYGIGVLELENGSNAYTTTKEVLYIGSQVSRWTVEKVFRNCELIIRE